MWNQRVVREKGRYDVEQTMGCCPVELDFILASIAETLYDGAQGLRDLRKTLNDGLFSST